MNRLSPIFARSLRWAWGAFLEWAALCGASYYSLPHVLDQHLYARAEEEDIDEQSSCLAPTAAGL